jgi:hypothetical protein
MKYGRVVMNIQNMLNMFWTPTKKWFAIYYGPQCLGNKDVHGFEGTASNHEGWQAYFDA